MSVSPDSEPCKGWSGESLLQEVVIGCNKCLLCTKLRDPKDICFEHQNLSRIWPTRAMETKDPKGFWSFQRNNTKRIYWKAGNREVHQYSKAKQKAPQSITKMVVIPDKRNNKTDDSKRFPTIQGPRPAIQYDSRPKASDSIAIPTIQDPRPAIL
jgi:hypothetical protein